MLILSRRIEESILIGDNIRVKILRIRGGNIRLGITAPKDISVHREEIYYRIHPEKNSSNSAKEKAYE